MSEEDDAERVLGGGFLARSHHKLYFTELDETFFARLILAKCPNPEISAMITVELSVCDLFRRFSADELAATLENETISESPKVLETIVDTFSTLLGFSVKATEKEQTMLDYYHAHILTRLDWLNSGDPGNKRLPCVATP